MFSRGEKHAPEYVQRKRSQLLEQISKFCFCYSMGTVKQWFITKFQLMAVTGSPRIVKLSLIFHEAVLTDPLLRKN
jgi:hypothetical protein